MNNSFLQRAGVIAASALTCVSLAHDLTGDPDHPHYDWSVHPPEKVIVHPVQIAQAANRREPPRSAANENSKRPAQAAPFEMFAPRVKVRWDASFLYIEDDGLPAHNLMVGITAWQQQVPMPQQYTGDNAWRFPLVPVPAAQPQTIKNHFLRGAIAIAANGIPIFNPQNNRGEISAEIGELDQWGGHCGRADDYHYHAAPLHLQSVVGKTLPIAYALDGYAIYGLAEPDGSPPARLDAFNGHATPAAGYHYHASTKYPYVNGGFHGQVVEANEQVDPQPRAQPVRPALPPLRGAKITGFTNSPDHRTCQLNYSVNGKPASIHYATADGQTWKFQFIGPEAGIRNETYNGDHRQGDGGPPDPRRRPR
jgi:hypothetical protein